MLSVFILVFEGIGDIQRKMQVNEWHGMWLRRLVTQA